MNSDTYTRSLPKKSANHLAAKLKLDKLRCPADFFSEVGHANTNSVESIRPGEQLCTVLLEGVYVIAHSLENYDYRIARLHSFVN